MSQRETKTNLRLAAYARVSTKAQAQDGYSLETQLKNLNDYAGAREGMHIAKEFREEGVSGAISFHRRPKFKIILKLLERKKIDGIIFTKFDRVSRNLRHLLELAELAKLCDWDLISINDPIDTTSPLGEFQLQLMGALAQLERAQIKLRVQSVVNKLRQDGRAVGRMAPFGFTFDDGTFVRPSAAISKTGRAPRRTLVPHPQEQRTLLRLLQMAQRPKPLGYFKIARRLTLEGYMGRQGKALTHGGVRGILKAVQLREASANVCRDDV